MKRYEGKYNKKSKGVFAISLVNAPATGEHYIAMAKQDKIVKFAKVDEEQRILMGLVLQPDQLIYRVDENGDEFEMFFSAETIKDFSQNFFQSGFQLNSKLEHDETIENVTFVESWLVADSKKDKSAAYGLSYPVGSWLVSMKVDNDDIWNNYIKTGELKGFSIDGMVELEEVNFKSNIQMSKSNKNILALLKQIVSGAEQDVEVTLGSVKSGELDIQFDGETLEVGTAVFLIADESEKVQLADGTYKIDDAGEIVVKDGLVESMSEGEEVVDEEVVEEVEPEAELAEEEEVIEEVNADEESMRVIKEILDDMFKAYAESMEIKMSALDAKLETLTSENVELKEQVVTLSAQPSVKPISSQPKQVAMTKQGRILETIKQANQNK
tara:strand:- start:491 stop:1642 length:1152 start_codon:yes stop_codon:yes gene_type:complete